MNPIGNSHFTHFSDQTPAPVTANPYHDVVGPDATKELKDLFEFTIGEDEASLKILQGIHNYRNQPELLQRITDTIKRGEWKWFLDEFRLVEGGHYALLAAFCYCPESNRLSTQQLTTAFYFLSVAMDDENYQIHNLVELENEFPTKQVSQSEGNSEAIKHIGEDPDFDKSQFVAISCSAAKMNKSPSALLYHLCKKRYALEGLIGIDVKWNELQSGRYAMPSVAVMERLLFKNDKGVFKPVLGATPREKFIEEIFIKKENPIALLLPDSKEIIHGCTSRGGALWFYVHDMYHAALRTERNTANDSVKLDLIEAVESLLKTRNLELNEVESGYIYPKLPKGATHDDLVTKFLLELEGMVIDSEGSDELNSSITPDRMTSALRTDLKSMLRKFKNNVGDTPEEDPRIAQFTEEELNSALDSAYILILSRFSLLSDKTFDFTSIKFLPPLIKWTSKDND